MIEDDSETFSYVPKSPKVLANRVELCRSGNNAPFSHRGFNAKDTEDRKAGLVPSRTGSRRGTQGAKGKECSTRKFSFARVAALSRELSMAPDGSPMAD